MAATEKGVWDLQEVRDKQLASEWSYDGVITGQLWAWGENEKGELGQNQKGSPGGLTGLSSPTQVGTNSTWSDIGGGGMEEYGGYAWKSDGTLWTWGSNAYGQLGLNEGSTYYSSPVQLPGNWAQRTDDDQFIDREVKISHRFWTLGIKTDGTLWSWGYSGSGNLGLNKGPNNNISSPAQVGSDTTWTSVMQGRDMGSFGIKTDGTLWAWGDNNGGRLGLNNANPARFSSPVQLPGTTWRSTRQGTGQHPLATKTDGTLWGWAGNNQGQLGQNSVGPVGGYSSPIQISGTTWRSVTTMSDSSAATKTDGTLWVWGDNEIGVLGLNQEGNAISSPTQIPGTDWMNITASQNHTLVATKTDNTLWTWGSNEFGTLGRNFPNNGHRSSPVQIPGTNWIPSRIGELGRGAWILRS